MARFEYRIFPAESRPFAQALSETLASAGSDDYRDVYLVDPWRLDVNLKVRDGQLEVKTRDTQHHAMERWTPRDEYPLPLAPAVAQRWFPRLAGAACATPAELYARVRDAGYQVIPVAKSRRKFEHEDLEGEMTSIEVHEATHTTLALEHEDPDCLASWVRRLAFDLLPNQSYITWLFRHGH